MDEASKSARYQSSIGGRLPTLGIRMCCRGAVHAGGAAPPKGQGSYRAYRLAICARHRLRGAGEGQIGADNSRRTVMKWLIRLVAFDPAHKQLPTGLVDRSTHRAAPRTPDGGVRPSVFGVPRSWPFRWSGPCSFANSIAGARRSVSGLCSNSSPMRCRCWYARFGSASPSPGVSSVAATGRIPPA